MLPASPSRVHFKSVTFASGACDAQAVDDIANARQALDQILGVAFFIACFHAARQHDLAIGDGDVDVAGVDVRIVRETLTHIFFDALVGTPITTRSAATEFADLSLLPAARLAFGGIATAI